MGNMYTSASLVKDVNNQMADSPTEGFVACQERCYPKKSPPSKKTNSITLVSLYQNQPQMQKSLPNFTSTKSLNGFNRWMMTLVMALFTLFASYNSSAQTTTLISPTGDGGFETGATPSANNWTAVNSTTDSWIVGTTPVVSAGARCAFISSGASAWTYSQTSTIQHLYYDVTIPSGQTKVTLSFKWKAGGEGTTTSDWDNLKIFWGTTALVGTPVANTAVSATYQVAGAGATSGMYKLSSASYNNETITLTGIAGSTYRLVLSWKSDITTIANPPAAVDEISLVSSVPAAANAAPTTFTAATVTQTSFTIGWTDNSTNETGFRVYRSTDNVNFTQFGADITSTSSATTGTTYSLAQTGLIAGQTYFYRIAAFFDLESAFLTASQATSPAGTKTAASGLWSVAGTWTPSGVPTATDDVVIPTGVTVTLDPTAALANNLSVTGTLTYNSATAGLTVTNNVTVNAGGVFQTALTGTATGHTLSLAGNFTNSGTVDFSNGGVGAAATRGVLLTFTGAANNTFSNSGAATTDIRSITVNKGTGTATLTSATLDIAFTGTGFSVRDNAATDPVGFLSLTNGIARISGSNTYNSVVFLIAGYSVGSTAGFWLNNSNYTVGGLNGSPTVTGVLRVSAGTLNIGTATGNSMGFATGSIIRIEGGTINAQGRFGVSAATSAINYFQSAGTITANINATGHTSTTLASFDLGTGASVVNISGGSIILQNSGGGASGPRDFRNSASGTQTITGGLLQLGNASTGATAKTFQLTGTAPSLTITNSAAHIGILAAQVNVLGNLTINSTATLNINSFAFLMLGNSVGTPGNVINNGIITNASATGTNRFSFSGTFGAQNYSGAGGSFGSATTPMAGISISNASGVSFSNTGTVTNRINLFTGALTGAANITIGNLANTQTIQVGGTATVNAGSLDANPTFNTAAGGFSILYSTALSAYTTGFEIPSSRLVSNGFTIGNPNGVTLAGGNVGVATLNISAGNLTTSSSNVLTVTGTGLGNVIRSTPYISAAGATASGTTITVGSTTGLVVGMPVYVTAGIGSLPNGTTVVSVTNATTFVVSAAPSVAFGAGAVVSGGYFVKGPMEITLPASLLTGSTYLLPVGKGNYNPFELFNATTGAGGTVVVRAEAFDANAGGTNGLSIGGLNTNRYWAASITSGSANFTNTQIRLTDKEYGVADAVTASSTLTGAYDLVGGVASTFTTISIATTAPAATTIPGFYVLGSKASPTLSALAITPSTQQCTSVARTVTITAAPGAAAVTSVVINYSVNGVAQTAITMTNTTLNDWSGVIPAVTPANATVAWSVTATDANTLFKTQAGTSYSDAPLEGLNASAVSSLSTVCSGSPINLTATLIRAGVGVTNPIGSGTTTTTATEELTAFCNRRVTYQHQAIFTAAELQAAGLVAGNISAISYNIASVGDGSTTSNYTVKMGTTSLSALTTTFVSGLTTVRNAATFTHAIGLNTITFNTPFAWNGTSNIIIDVTHGGVDLTNNAQTSYTTMATNMQSFGFNGATTATLTLNRLNVRFTQPPTNVAFTSVAWVDNLTSSSIGTVSPLTISPLNTPAASAPITNQTYTATITALGCPVTATTSAITVNSLPVAPSDPAGGSSQCGTGVPTAFVTGGTSGQYRWYTSASATTPIAGETGANLTTTSISLPTTFYVAINNGTCESARTPILADVVSPDAVTARANSLTTGILGCINRNIALSVEQTNNNQNYTYTWQTVPANAVGSGITATLTGGNQTITPTAAGTYTYIVTATDGGCVATSTVSVTVNTLPVIASTTATPSTVCAGAPVVLAATTNIIATGNVTLGTGTTTNTTSSYPAAFGTYWGNTRAQYLIRATELTALGLTAGNINSVRFNVTALGSPVACTGYTVKIGNTTNTVISSTAISTASTTVFGPTTFTPVVGTNTVTFSTPFNWDGTSNIFMDICFNNGVTGSTNSLTTLSTTTFVSSGYFGNDGVVSGGVCGNGLTSGTASSRPIMIFNGQTLTTGAGTLNWAWSNSPGPVGTGNSITINPLTTDTYTVTATNSITTCTNTGSALVTVNPLPEAPIGANSTQCGNAIPTASVATGGANGSGVFNWYATSNATTPLQTGTSTTYLTAISTATSFFVSEVGTNGCESNRTQVDVTIEEADGLSIAATPSAICIGNTVNLVTTQTGGSNSYIFTYSASPNTGSGLTGSENTDNVTITPTAPGTYIYTITGFDPDKGCTATSQVTVTVNALPVITTATATPATICAGATVNLAATVINAAPGSSAVGAGSSASSGVGTPFYGGWGGTKVQYIYTAAELAASNIRAGNITALGLNVTAAGATPYQGFAIQIGATTQSVFATANAINTGLTQVFAGPLANSGYLPTVGLNTFTFSSPFNWDGTSNIVVSICYSNATTSNPASTVLTDVYTGINKAMYIYADSQTPATVCGATTTIPASGGSSTSTVRPRTTFTGIVGPDVTSSFNWVWNPGAISGGTTGTASVTPSTTTTYTATATSIATGCTSTSSDVVVTVNPVPDAPVAAPSTQCGAGVPTASITGTGGTYKWYDAATGNTVLQTGGTTYATSISTPTHFWVSETSAAGCESARTDVFADVTTPDPLTASASSISVCLGSDVTLTGTVGAGANNSIYALTWSASPATGSGIATTLAGANAQNGFPASVTITPSAVGTYTYNVAGTDGFCNVTSSITVDVNANPVITSATASPANTCAGGNTTLTAAIITVGTGNVTLGVNDGVAISTTGTPYRTGTTSGTTHRTQYLVLASELTAAGISAGNINSLGLRVTTITPTGFMENLTLSLAHTSATALTTTYETTALTQVYTAATYAPVSGTNTHAFSTPFNWNGTSNILIQFCGTLSAAGSGSGTSLETYNAGFVSTVANNTTCAATTGTTQTNNRPVLIFNAQTNSDLTGSFTYNWNPGNTTGNPITVNPVANTTYTVIATNPSTSCVSAPVTVDVTIVPLTAIASATVSTLCVGGSTVLNATPTGGSTFTYSWSDGTSVVSTAQSFTATPAVTTTYTVTVTNNCGNTTTAQATVTVNPLPTATIAGTFPPICAPATYTLNATTDAAATIGYQWRNAAGNISGQTSSSYVVSASGSYSVRITDGVTGCINTSNTVAITVNAAPVPVTLSPLTATVCSGIATTLTASSGATGSGAIGTGTTTNTITAPYKGFWGGHKAQYLFTAAELTGLGLTATSPISAIAMNVSAFTGPYTLNGFTISMKNTTATELTATPESGTTTVFGPTNYVLTGTAPFVVSHTLASTFTWNGTSNLIVEFCFNNNDGGGASANSATVTSSITTGNLTSYLSVDNSPTVCSTTSGWTTSTTRPNITFSYNSSSPITWSPATGLNTTSGNTVIATPTNTTASATTVTYVATATTAAGCTATNSAVITVNPATTITSNATPSSQTVLVNDPSPSAITVAATGTGTVTYQWFSNTTNSTTGGTSLGVTAQTASYTPPTSTLGTRYYYCVVTASCGTLTSAVAAVTVTNSNSWKAGNTTNNWSIASNWSGNAVPTSTNDAVIPFGNTPYPVLTSSVAVQNLTIDPGATITLGSNTFTLNGQMLSTGGFVGSENATIVTNATTDLYFDASGNTVKNLNVNAGTTTVANTLNVTAGSSANSFGTVTVATGATLNANGNLVLKSNINGTARVAANNSSNYITGEVTVERHIAAGTKRAWRLLSVPTKGAQTVKTSWQENQPTGANGNPGFGTFVTANTTALLATGFDFTTSSANMQRYNSVTQSWVNITSTNNSVTDLMQTNRAYFLYVRGDRTVTPSVSTATLIPTVLRTKGTLYQGTLTAEAVSVGAGKFEPVGNLYASAIDFTGLTRTGGVSSTFYIWDPKAGNSTVLGTYQTFNPLNDYKPFLPGSYGTAVGGANPFRRNTLIESGQGFMVTATGSAGTIALQESAKTAGTGQQVFRPTAGIQKLKANLYIVNGANTSLADGNLAAFDAAFSNNIDGDDAYKFANAGENFGINRSNTKLVVEARQPVITKDTVFYEMWNMTAPSYRLEFIPTEMNVVGLTAVLKDKYLGTTTPINLSAGSVNHDFMIDANAASKDINRFSVIFTQAAGGSLPVNFISLSANRTGAAVKVDWKVASENGIRNYEVQRSTDGRTFNTAGTVTATGNNTSREIAYTWLDAAPFSGTSFYRVKSVGVAGDIKYTNIAKIAGGDVKPGYTISPNPVEGSTVNLTFKNQAKGRYNINLITNDGRVIYTTIAEHAGGNSTQILNLPSFIARGAYQIEIVSPDKKKDVQTLFINTTK